MVMQIDQILTAAVRGGASDVVLKTGALPRFRFRGDLVAPENGSVITEVRQLPGCSPRGPGARDQLPR